MIEKSPNCLQTARKFRYVLMNNASKWKRMVGITQGGRGEGTASVVKIKCPI
jgi:hypothetical protein